MDCRPFVLRLVRYSVSLPADCGERSKCVTGFQGQLEIPSNWPKRNPALMKPDFSYGRAGLKGDKVF